MEMMQHATGQAADMLATVHKLGTCIAINTSSRLTMVNLAPAGTLIQTTQTHSPM
jgi:hypothetical protein